MNRTTTETAAAAQAAPATTGPPGAPPAAQAPPAWLAHIKQTLRQRTFQPHPLLRGGHAQTLGAFAWPRRRGLRAHLAGAARTFEVEPGVSVLAHCRWQTEPRAHPTIIIVHGLEGSSASIYAVGTAAKAYRAGFNTVRLNLRTCGDTYHLTHTLYHAGMSHDLRAVVEELSTRDQLPDIFIGGFSLGGNLSLKLAGETGADLPPAVRAVFAVSPSIDLAVCADAIMWRRNWLYHRQFVTGLRRRLRVAQRVHPARFDLRDLNRVRTIRDFDARYTAPYGGFRDVDDYYLRASALPYLADIRRPTIIVHAQDDPFVPYKSFQAPALTTNPFITLLAPPHGGHVGFLAAAPEAGGDRFWAEHRVVEFCRLVYEHTRA